MQIDDIKALLVSRKSAERLRAAKRISKEKITELAADLFVAYEKERQDPRTWEPQSEMIKGLGVLDYKPALDIITTIVQQNIPHDMITINAAIAFVQLKRQSIFDAEPVLELLSFGSTSVICGALEALAVDKMLPTAQQIQKIIRISWDINKHPDRIGYEYGLIDPRIYLAIACAGWDKALCSDFLTHCIETAYNINSFNKPVAHTKLIEVCQKSLKGKYTSI
jgi:hypothetical protein